MASGTGPLLCVHDHQNQPLFPPSVQPLLESGFTPVFDDHCHWKQTPGEGSVPLVVVRG
ncbi:MAG: hypothetical protein H0W87_04345 [Actinobacteria bacterium]|nr:hypothetical protein [Actinomycetota bacterium]